MATESDRPAGLTWERRSDLASEGSAVWRGDGLMAALVKPSGGAWAWYGWLPGNELIPDADGRAATEEGARTAAASWLGSMA